MRFASYFHLGRHAFALLLGVFVSSAVSSCGAMNGAMNGATRRANERPHVSVTALPGEKPVSDVPDDSAPGVIACGLEVCTAGVHRCCPYPEMRCHAFDEPCPEPRGMALQDGWQGDRHFGLECDDHGDCGSKRCCQWWFDGYTVSCEERCGDYEVCRAGGDCGEGLVCARSPWSMTGFLCQPAQRGASCGDRRCPADRPYCCLHDEGSEKRCATDATGCVDASQMLSRAFACTAPADCGSYACCLGVGVAHCAASCRLDQEAPLCVTVEDCPTMPPHELVGCEPEVDLPLSTCRYRLVG